MRGVQLPRGSRHFLRSHAMWLPCLRGNRCIEFTWNAFPSVFEVSISWNRYLPWVTEKTSATYSLQGGDFPFKSCISIRNCKVKQACAVPNDAGPKRVSWERFRMCLLFYLRSRGCFAICLLFYMCHLSICTKNFIGIREIVSAFLYFAVLFFASQNCISTKCLPLFSFPLFFIARIFLGSAKSPPRFCLPSLSFSVPLRNLLSDGH